jgi:hypothetical protein
MLSDLRLDPKLSFQAAQKQDVSLRSTHNTARAVSCDEYEEES